MTLTEPSDNSFDNIRGDNTMTGIGENRKFDRTGKKQIKKKRKQELSEIKDEDVRREVAKGAKLISYSSGGDS